MHYVFKILISLFVAVLITLFFSLVIKKKGPWKTIWPFLIIMFLAAWAGALWLNPIGPQIWGINWLPIIFFGILFALVLVEAAPDKGYTFFKRKTKIASDQPDFETKKEKKIYAFGLFFWIIVILLIAAIFSGYLLNEPGEIRHN